MGSVVLGSLLVLMDTTFIAISLPILADDLDARVGAEWAITAFLLSTGISQIAAGWLSDRVGPKRVYVAAAAGFGISAIAVAASPTLGTLVAARCVQGLCGGFLVPLATALAYSMFPEGRRGTAVGLSGTVMMIGPLVAPLVSGLVLDALSWRVLILIDVPIAATAAVLGARKLPDEHARVRRPFDGIGLVLIAAAVVALLVAAAEAERWAVPLTIVVTGAAIGLVVAFVAYASRTEHPLIDLSIFRVPAFSLSLAIVATVAVSQFARTVFMPLELQSLRGLTPFRTGLALMPAALASAIAMPIGGRWTDRAGGRRPVIFGLVLIVVSALGLGALTLDTPLVIVMGLMVVNNAGIVFCTMSVTLVGLDAVASRLVPHAAALRSLTRQVSGALGTAVFATIITAQVGSLATAGGSRQTAEQAQDAYNVGFLLAAAIAVLGLVLARRLPSRAPTRTPAQVVEP